MVAESGGIALGPVAAADAHIERPGAAMMAGGLLEADDEIAPIGRPEPDRHGAAQHAADPPRQSPGAALALVGNDEDDLAPWCCAREKEAMQSGMRLVLAQAVEVERGIDLHMAARQLLAGTALQRGEVGTRGGGSQGARWAAGTAGFRLAFPVRHGAISARRCPACGLRRASR